MRPGEEPAVLAMMRALWPDCDDAVVTDRVLVWERPDGGLGGFASHSLRTYAEGCASSPCPFLEGWWVAPELRRGGVGRALIAALEDWCRAEGYAELASDASEGNALGIAAHGALGFETTARIVCFRKSLVGAAT